jgi:hypothetical protein
MIKKLACFGVVGMALIGACGGTNNDLGDASSDATTSDQAVDAPVEAAADVHTNDVAQDVAQDVSQDAPQDVTSDADASVDAPADVASDVSEASTDAGGCKSSLDCLSTEYCDKALGDCSGTGTCTAIPSFCSSLCSYLCGCDNMTYCNSCYAAKNGRTTIAYAGACE